VAITASNGEALEWGACPEDAMKAVVDMLIEESVAGV
jgi:hypothetical protein